MSEYEENYWFSAKKYGVGWFLPASWEGWIVYAVYAGLLIGLLPRISTPSLRILFVAFATLLLVAIVVWKGERPFRWRWGGR